MCCRGGGGTISFVAPEKILYDIRYPQSDIWSLGASMYSILTGKIIWGNRDLIKTTFRTVINAIQLEQPEELKSGNLLLDNLINGMTKKDINKRLTVDKIKFMLKDM